MESAKFVSQEGTGLTELRASDESLLAVTGIDSSVELPPIDEPEVQEEIK